MHAATRAGAFHPAGREALLRYVLRPPIAQERLELRPDGLVCITLKKADGTIAVDMDPLSLLCRLATSVPPPRRHTIRYSGVLAPASPWRRGLAPLAPSETPKDGQRPPRPQGAPSYRPWAQLLARTYALDVLACPKCHGRMRPLTMVEDPANIARYLAASGEPTEVPPRSPGRGPPYWNSRVLRRQALVEEDDGRGGEACPPSRIEATRRPPLKRQRASPGPAGVGNRPGWAAPPRLVDPQTTLVLPTLPASSPSSRRKGCRDGEPPLRRSARSGQGRPPGHGPGRSARPLRPRCCRRSRAPSGSWARQVIRGGKVEHLPPKVCALLTTLLDQRPGPVSKAELHRRLWPDTFVSDANLAGLVKELRGILGDLSRSPRYIRTVHRYGYAFCGTVRTEGDDERSEAGVPVSARLVLGRREVALTLGEHVLGRSPEAVVWIDSDSVSRRHARIAVTGAGASIEDLGSKNGTYVNGVRVGGSRPLADGDELRIGSVRMLFRQFSGPPSTASEAADPDGGTGPS